MKSDIRIDSARENRSAPDDAAREGNWWLDEANDEEFRQRARKINVVAQALWKQLAPVRQTMLNCARLYGNAPIMGLGPRSYRSLTTGVGRWNRISINVAKAVADTYVSMITEKPPKVTVLTSGGNHELQERAKNLEKLCDGIFTENDIHEKDQMLVLDTAEYHLSVEHWYADVETDPENAKIVCERILPWELLVDEATCQYGELPREVYIVRHRSRWGLIEALRAKGLDKLAERVRTVDTPGFEEVQRSGDIQFTEQPADLVVVIEAWRTSRTKTSKDGLHCIIVGDVLLNPKDQTYARTDFPLEMNWRLRPSTGIYGSPLVDELSGGQRELNTLLARAARAMHLCAVPHLLVEESSKVNTNALNNDQAGLIKYTGIAPVPLVFSGVPPDMLAHAWRIKDEMYAVIGVNPMSAQGMLPPGVKSGRAMRTLADVTTKRFTPSYRNYQSLQVRRFRQIIACAREIEAKGKRIASRAGDGSMMKDVEWAAAKLDDAQFQLHLYTTNALSDEPAERIEQVQEIQGLPPHMKRLLDFPDLKADASYEQASYDLVMRIGDAICADGEKGYEPPSPGMNLNPDDPDGAIQWMDRIAVRATVDKVPEERVALLYTWIDQATEMWAAAHPPPPPPPPPPMMAPGGPPPMAGPPIGPPGAPPGVPPMPAAA